MVADRPLAHFDLFTWRKLVLFAFIGLAAWVYHNSQLKLLEQDAFLEASRIAEEEARIAAEQAALNLSHTEYSDEMIIDVFNSLLSPPYTKLDFFGAELDLTANQWQCVKSNDTHLVWEVKTRDGGLRDAQFTYSWFTAGSVDAMPVSGRPDGGSCLYANCDTDAYIEAINQRKLCGRSNWRLPSTAELESLVYDTVYIPKLDPRFFPHGRSYYYWSDTIYANYYDPDKFAHFPGMQSFQYWSQLLSINDYSLMTSVNFLNGFAYGARKSRNYHIRLVSDG
ncbi:MAG: DUF1566 domain-containing protein [Pseudomonadota bacterium]